MLTEGTTLSIRSKVICMIPSLTGASASCGKSPVGGSAKPGHRPNSTTHGKGVATLVLKKSLDTKRTWGKIGRLGCQQKELDEVFVLEPLWEGRDQF